MGIDPGTIDLRVRRLSSYTTGPPPSSLFGIMGFFCGAKLPFSAAARRIEDGKDGQILVSQMGGGMTDAGSVNAFSGFGVFVVARRRHVSSFGDGCQEVGNYRYEHAAREMPWGGGMRMDREEDARRRQQRLLKSQSLLSETSTCNGREGPLNMMRAARKGA